MAEFNLDPITGTEAPEEIDNSFIDRVAAGMELQNPLSRIAVDVVNRKPLRKPDFGVDEKYSPTDDANLEKSSLNPDLPVNLST